MFHISWVFSIRLPLEGESTSYRFAVVYGETSKPGEEAGLREVYTLNRKSPPEDQEVGVEAEPEKEPEEVVEQPIEEAPAEEEPVEEAPEEVPPSEEAPLAEEAVEDSPPEEVTAEEITIEEAPLAEEVEETTAEEEPEPEVVEEVAEEAVPEESEPELEPVPDPEPEPEPAGEEKKLILEPKSPVFVEGNWRVKGTVFGIDPNKKFFVTVEKATSADNGWEAWQSLGVRPDGERTPA